ncbi:MAG: 3-isopropylmalate dehydratase large subunit [Synergistota bacterium]|nr:3-isopropylmalate dehydratase large subunit [Synergistota bacterium]
MGMTITEKILANASGEKLVKPGQFVTASVNTVATMDTLGKIVFDAFEQLKMSKIPFPEKFVICLDHQVPANEVKYANVQKSIRELASKYGVKHFYDVGRGGILHQILPEKGHIIPGTVNIATESHTPTGGALGAVVVGVGQTEAAMALATGDIWLRVPPTIKVDLKGRLNKGVMAKDISLFLMKTLGFEKKAVYRAIEFAGEAVRSLTMDSRLTLTNMVADMGAKNGIFPVDEITVEYLRGRTERQFKMVQPDPDAKYEEILSVDLSTLEPHVTCHPSMEDAIPVSRIGKVPVNQAVLGSCTNGRFEDLYVAAEILKGKKIAPSVRMLVLPASQEVLLRAMKAGLLDIFAESGAMIGPPSCGPCHGGHFGLLGDDETAISSTNRNFVGRMGSKKSKVFLASPATVAASALSGYISDPRAELF